jgi:TDG/mug DNA glycosylase family protein
MLPSPSIPPAAKRHPAPSPEELRRAVRKRLPDRIAPDLRILFCGINPGLYSAAIGHHFGRPGNRFWPVLHRAELTPRLFDPSEDVRLVELGIGLTNLVARPTARADALSATEIRDGATRLAAKVRRYRPRHLAVLGIGAYRIAFDQPRASVGPQPLTLGDTSVWALPNPSGLNAHYSAETLIEVFATLHRDQPDPR